MMRGVRRTMKSHIRTFPYIMWRKVLLLSGAPGNAIMTGTEAGSPCRGVAERSGSDGMAYPEAVIFGHAGNRDRRMSVIKKM